MSEISATMRDLSQYIADALHQPLPPEVAEKGRHHLLDTLAAIVSGSRLGPGEAAIGYVKALGGTPEALVLGTTLRTNAVNAALANGMLAHADETDDSHKDSRSHPGCGVVPAALAMAERQRAGGQHLLRALVLGYDISARITPALGVDAFYEGGHSTHTFAPLFGAAAAAGALAGLSAKQVPWLLSYTAQQASGVNCWARDEDHIEKAFDFGGMPARNAVTAATMVQAGFTGVNDVFSGPRNFFFAFSAQPRPELLLEGLGSRYEIMHTNLKKWSVGSPVQAVMDSVLALLTEHDLHPEDCERIEVRMSDKESHVVDNRSMANINLQHLVSVMILDRGLSFRSSHDDARMRDPAAQGLRERVALIADPELPRRQPVVTLTARDGRSLTHRTPAVRGTPDNPMPREEVGQKATDLMESVLGAERTRELVARVWEIESVTDANDLAPLLTA